MFILVMTTATFAGGGITAIVQNRVLNVEVVDTNLYNITVLDQTDRLIGAEPMTLGVGEFKLEIPEGNDFIRILVTNIHTGAYEVMRLRVE